MTKWTEELTARLTDLAGEGEVSRDTVAEIADALEISSRSASSKLRKMGYEVEKAGAPSKNFSEDETENLRALVENNSGELTYAQIAEQLGTGHTARSVQGKILSMELTGHVAATPPKEAVRTYTDAETATVVEMCKAGNFVEEIAAAVGKDVNSVRGKALSLLRAEAISALPVQRDRKETAQDAFEALGAKISTMSVDELVEATGKTARGVKTILTRRKLVAADYDGAKRAERASS